MYHHRETIEPNKHIMVLQRKELMTHRKLEPKKPQVELGELGQRQALGTYQRIKALRQGRH